MYRNISFSQQTLTDAGTVTLNPAHKIEQEFEGTLNFAVTATADTGTLDGDCQLQGSLDGTNWANIGSAVAIADATTVSVPLGGTIIYFGYYRVVITGVGTQSTLIDAAYLARGRS